MKVDFDKSAIDSGLTQSDPHADLGSRTTNYAWTVVALLWPVACLNYLDRLMLTSMRDSIRAGIAMAYAAGALNDVQFGLHRIFQYCAAGVVVAVLLLLLVKPRKELDNS